MADELESAINEVKSILQPLFSKPKLSSKLLSKPPFRFIHDIVTSTLDSTGFPDGLFEPVELQSSTYKDDKAAKLSFLDKLIHLTNVGSGHIVEVSSSKIVAGIEPLSTNILLANFGRIAVNQDLDRSAVIQHCRDGLGVEEYQRHSTLSNVDTGAPIDQDIMETKAEMVPDDAFIGKVSIESNLNTSSPSLKDQIRACNEDIEQTIQMISRIVSKPKCTEKLLSKPPFRYLGERFVFWPLITLIPSTICNSVNLVSSSNEEMNSGNIKDKQQKLAFLDKLIQFLSIKTGLSIDVKSIKIIAGLEAERTRFLLQVYSVVAARKISSDTLGNENLALQLPVDVPNETKPDKNEHALIKTEVELETVSTPEIPMTNHMPPPPLSVEEEKIVDSITDEDDQSLPDFDEWLAAESGELEGSIKPNNSGTTLRLNFSSPSTSLNLPSKLSTEDLESIAAAVQGITELTDSLSHLMSNSDREVMNQESTYWSKQILQ
eukprot:scaffold36296_cov115-Cyclotella_meneghiniana.AAC.8